MFRGNWEKIETKNLSILLLKKLVSFCGRSLLYISTLILITFTLLLYLIKTILIKHCQFFPWRPGHYIHFHFGSFGVSFRCHLDKWRSLPNSEKKKCWVCWWQWIKRFNWCVFVRVCLPWATSRFITISGFTLIFIWRHFGSFIFDEPFYLLSFIRVCVFVCIFVFHFCFM